MSVNYNEDNQRVTLFVVGSHSLKRSKVKDKKTYTQNRERITKVKDGFLIIAGPVGDGNSPYQLYFWNGVDSIPGKQKEQIVGKTILKKVGEIPTFRDAKAEGITIIKEMGFEYEVMIVYDSVDKGSPALFKVARPKS